ncbi:MAG TPA: hypothetical protein VKW06_07250 [Candidatus Angelobacter sp.]|nr:hypothetical protein [Candidatus Angelobacter sp.]
MPQELERLSLGPTVLLVAEQSSARGLISAYLTMMGCNCLTPGDELDAIDPETVQAVLIDWNDSAALAEKVIVKLGPAFAGRILVMHAAAAHPRIVELADQFSLRLIAEENWPRQLWPMLREIIVGGESADGLPHHLEAAQLTFDSFRAPAPAGVRGSQAPARQLAFRHQNAMIDLFIQPREDSGRVWVAGQVLEMDVARGQNSGLPVWLVSATRTLARTTTNQYGEFSLDFDALDASGLQIGLRDGAWASLPFGNTDWVRVRLAGPSSQSSSENKEDPLDEPPVKDRAKEQGNGQ